MVAQLAVVVPAEHKLPSWSLQVAVQPAVVVVAAPPPTAALPVPGGRRRACEVAQQRLSSHELLRVDG